MFRYGGVKDTPKALGLLVISPFGNTQFYNENSDVLRHRGK